MKQSVLASISVVLVFMSGLSVVRCATGRALAANFSKLNSAWKDCSKFIITNTFCLYTAARPVSGMFVLTKAGGSVENKLFVLLFQQAELLIQ